MKMLHTFALKDSGGKERKLGIKKPTRREIDEADMVYSAYMSECISRGILTKDMLLKRYKDFGGALSEEEVKLYRGLMQQMLELNKQVQKTKSVKKKKLIEAEMEVVFESLQDIERSQEDLFSRTAEVIARNRTILWLALLLTFDMKGTPAPLFSGEDHDERYDEYSKFEEESFDDSQALLEKVCMYVAFWYSNRVVTEEDFKSLETFLNEDEEDEPEQEEEPISTDAGGDN